MTTAIIIFAVGAFIFYYAVPVIKNYNTCETLAPQLRSLSSKGDNLSRKYGFDKGVDYDYVYYIEDIKFRYEHLKALAVIGDYEYSPEEVEYAFGELQKIWEEGDRVGAPYWQARESLKALTGYRFMSGIKHKGKSLESYVSNE